MIDYSNCIFILEDIIDTFPIKDMETLFDILENSLKSQLNKSIVKIKFSLKRGFILIIFCI